MKSPDALVLRPEYRLERGIRCSIELCCPVRKEPLGTLAKKLQVLPVIADRDIENPGLNLELMRTVIELPGTYEKILVYSKNQRDNEYHGETQDHGMPRT
ncbi:hypothetical protein [Paraburkholderia sp. UCT2]|uniref:hypothetical protein n=1 Tax=Paraburkholderia sp. UCT2 TaxID=2615208 RepID=UPI0016554654|nr:hypothetical protein [Paraburkholderia sp. UCT2]